MSNAEFNRGRVIGLQERPLGRTVLRTYRTRVDIDDVIPNDRQPRLGPKEDEELQRQIDDNEGLFEPLLVEPHPEINGNLRNGGLLGVQARHCLRKTDASTSCSLNAPSASAGGSKNTRATLMNGAHIALCTISTRRKGRAVSAPFSFRQYNLGIRDQFRQSCRCGRMKRTR